MAFGFGATSVLRGNRALVKKRKFKDIKQLLLETSGKTEVEFKEVSPSELERIKAEIRSEARRKSQWELLIYGLCALLLLLLLAMLFVYLFFIY